MSETLFYNPGTTIATDTIATGNISVNLDLLDRWLYLRPSVSNAATIVAGMSRLANTYGQSVFGTNVFSTQGVSNGSIFGSTTSTAMYGTTYIPGGYVFQVDGNGPGVCALFSSKENTVTNYSIPNTGGNKGAAGTLLPDSRTLILPNSSGVNWTVWNNITRTSSTPITLAAGQLAPTYGSCYTADGNIVVRSNQSNIFLLNTTTFAVSNALDYGTGTAFAPGMCLDVTGNVILPPSGSSGVGVWNPNNGQFTRITPTSNPTNPLWGATNAGDGRVVFGVTNDANNLWVYNPFTLTCTTVSYSWGAGWKFSGVRSMPDGRVLMTPWGGGTYFGIFNPYTNSISTFTPGNGVPISYIGGTFVPDGRLIIGNNTGYSNIPVMTSLFRSIPEAWCMSPITTHGWI